MTVRKPWNGSGHTEIRIDARLSEKGQTEWLRALFKQLLVVIENEYRVNKFGSPCLLWCSKCSRLRRCRIDELIDLGFVDDDERSLLLEVTMELLQLFVDAIFFKCCYMRIHTYAVCLSYKQKRIFCWRCSYPCDVSILTGYVPLTIKLERIHAILLTLSTYYGFRLTWIVFLMASFTIYYGLIQENFQFLCALQ